MTRTQSLIAIQTVLSASFGCIMYLRCGPVPSSQPSVTSIDGTLPSTVFVFPNHVPESRPSVRSRFANATRNLLPEDNFCNGTLVPWGLYSYLPLTTGFLARLVVGDSESAPGSTCSQATTDGGRVSNFKIMAVRRGFSSEGDLLLDYLEKGVFHALEKQYLKRFILALYLVRDPLLTSTSISVSALV